MNLKTVKNIVDTLLKSNMNVKNVIWVWHGGEPLMMSKEFYKESYKILNSVGINKVSIQSNGVLYDEEFAEMFVDMGWSISFSFDLLSNDLTRGHTDEIINAFNIYKKYNDRFPGIIKIVDRNNIHLMCDDYDYAKEIGLNGVEFNRVFKSNNADVFKDNHINEYLNEYANLLEKWIYDNNPLYIRKFIENINYILGIGETVCKYKGNCINEWMGINPIGDLYPCDRYFPEEFKYGNIYEFENIEEIKLSSTYRKIKSIVKKRKYFCREEEKCEVYNYCNGGCNAIAINSTGGERPDELECYLTKKELTHIINILMDIDINKINNPMLKESLIESGFRNISFIKRLEREDINARYNFDC